MSKIKLVTKLLCMILYSDHSHGRDKLVVVISDFIESALE